MSKKFLVCLAIMTFSLSLVATVKADETTTTATNTTTNEQPASIEKATPLKQLSTIERLSQSIGLSVDEIQAELDGGKTLQEVAADHGMPAANYKARILNANFNLLSAKKTPVKTVVKKTVKKTVKTTTKKVVAKKTPTKAPVKKITAKKVIKTPIKTVVKKTIKK